MTQEVEIEFLNWPHPKLGVTPIQVEGGKPLVLKAKINLPQRTWVGLTDEEIDELHGSPMNLEHSGALKWVRIIEAKLKEKNT